jgi:hypothetical protein
MHIVQADDNKCTSTRGSKKEKNVALNTHKLLVNIVNENVLKNNNPAEQLRNNVSC